VTWAGAIVIGKHRPCCSWCSSAAHASSWPGPVRSHFLVSAPEHGTPRRARGYLITGQAVSENDARYSGDRSQLDDVSRRAIGAATHPHEMPLIPQTTAARLI